MSSVRRKAKTNGRTGDDMRELKRENLELKKKLNEAERQFRRVIQAWAKEKATDKDRAFWEREIKKGAKGGSLLALIQTLEKEVE
ncbi:MAG: hypothetical protein L0Y72_29985 [Gemmataceae bacterium]|nr:hypothetical protein [Gemmataceae bacterium]MCI0743278.1 hypothetical protein [Gemmataceae bacterium]